MIAQTFAAEVHFEWIDDEIVSGDRPLRLYLIFVMVHCYHASIQNAALNRDRT